MAEVGKSFKAQPDKDQIPNMKCKRSLVIGSTFRAVAALDTVKGWDRTYTWTI
jgi:hypothetical protein